jgi:hypothetical protein
MPTTYTETPAVELTLADIGRRFIILDGSAAVSGILVDLTAIVKRRRDRDSFATTFHTALVTIEYGTTDGGNCITVNPYTPVLLGPHAELPAGARYTEDDA